MCKVMVCSSFRIRMQVSLSSRALQLCWTSQSIPSLSGVTWAATGISYHHSTPSLNRKETMCVEVGFLMQAGHTTRSKLLRGDVFFHAALVHKVVPFMQNF